MSELTKLVSDIGSALDSMESELDQGRASAAVLEDFKVTVDTVRTSVLAILTAAQSGEYQGFIRKFRLRRAAQVCQNVLSGIVDGTVNPDTPGFEQLESTVDETLERLVNVARAG